jgi:outer membrane protein TolC
MKILVTTLTTTLVAMSCHAAGTDESGPVFSPTVAIVDSLADPELRRLAIDALDRNPRLAVLGAEARAAEQRAPQVRSLPDPTASLTIFLMAPQTRVGPQRASLSLSQQLPWLGKLRLEEQAAMLVAVAAWTRVESARLELLTRVRRLYHELQYLDREAELVTGDRATLEHYEELARARYASGIGIGQVVIKIQAELTRARLRLLGISERRAALLAELNGLRDRPDPSPITIGAGVVEVGPTPLLASLRDRALSARPELAEAQALIDAAQLKVELARKQRRPDFRIGLSYALVGSRDDDVGRLSRPQGNGDDILGLTGGISLPIWQERLAAGVEEAVQQRLAAEASQRAVVAEIDADLADLTGRVPLIQEQVQLFDEVLTVQAEESLQSAESAYASGTVSVLDLLDAERVLLQVRLGAERARTDLAIAIAKLEGAIAGPLANHRDGGGS